MKAKAYVVMLGVSPEMRGGIAAVAASLLEGGLAHRIPLRYINTYAQEGSMAKALAFLQAAGRLVWALLGGRVALVHAHVASNGSFWRKSLLMALARMFDVPTVLHLHGGGFAEFVANQRRPLIVRWIRHTFEASSLVVVLSPSWEKWARAFAPRAVIETVANPVRLPKDLAMASSSAAGRPPGCVGVVLYLGLISEAKGCFDLLRAWVLFRAQVTGWRMQIGGNGAVEALLAEARRLGVSEDMDYLGWIADEAKDAALRRADIFVLPSYKEGVPISVLEAMAYGLPVVTTPVGGIPDILNGGIEGLMVPPGSAAALAGALQQLASSDNLRRTLGDAGRHRVSQHHSTGTIVQRWLEIYAANAR